MKEVKEDENALLQFPFSADLLTPELSSNVVCCCTIKNYKLQVLMECLWQVHMRHKLGVNILMCTLCYSYCACAYDRHIIQKCTS